MRPSPRTIAIALAAVVGGAIGMSAAPAAYAADVPLHFDLGTVLPGSSASASHALVVDRDARVASAAWLEQNGPDEVVWTTRLCGPDLGCVAMEDLSGTRLSAGVYDLTVTVSLPTAPVSGTLSATADGALSLVEPSPALAVTGGETPWTAAMIGAMVCALGAFLLVRRRREDAR